VEKLVRLLEAEHAAAKAFAGLSAAERVVYAKANPQSRFAAEALFNELRDKVRSLNPFKKTSPAPVKPSSRRIPNYHKSALRAATHRGFSNLGMQKLKSEKLGNYDVHHFSAPKDMKAFHEHLTGLGYVGGPYEGGTAYFHPRGQTVTTRSNGTVTHHRYVKRSPSNESHT
jgi:hypothetical protein